MAGSRQATSCIDPLEASEFGLYNRKLIQPHGDMNEFNQINNNVEYLATLNCSETEAMLKLYKVALDMQWKALCFFFCFIEIIKSQDFLLVQANVINYCGTNHKS